MKKSELFFNIILIPLDILAILLGFSISYYTRKHLDPFEIIYIPPLWDYLKYIALFLPMWIFVFTISGLYNIKSNRKVGTFFYKTLVAVPTALMIFISIIFFTKDEFFSRLVIIYSLFFILGTTLLFRLTVWIIQKILYRYGVGVKRILVIGTGKISREIINDIERHPSRGYRIIGVIKTTAKIECWEFKSKIIGELKDIGSIVAKYNPDEIMQTDPTVTTNENMNIIHLCEDKHKSFSFVPNLFSLYSKNNDMETFGKNPVFEIRRSRLDGWGRIAKRIIDIIGALVGIIITLPFQIIIAILIKITSKGPVLFKQKRVGRDGEFTFLKFRTMYDDAESRHKEFIKKYGNMFKLKEDPRVTKIGRFLRKTSLDELPQFYNALIGNMSLVGPRPPMPIEVSRYTREEMKRIGGVKPGITGLWQVSGRSDTDFEEWIKLDVYYIENWSIFLDFIIILKTIWVVIFGKGAY